MLFSAGLGAVFGGLAGLVSGSILGPGVLSNLNFVTSILIPLPMSLEDLLPTAALQIGGIIGALIGIVGGAVVFAWAITSSFWTLLYEGDPTWPVVVAVGQVVTAYVVAYIYTYYSSRSEFWRLSIAGVRRPSRREAEWLVPMLRQAATRMGAQDIPRLVIDDSREPNAFAGIHHIVVNQGLLEYLVYDEEAVAGVLAHEVAHWHSGDARAMAWSKGIAMPLYLATNLVTHIRSTPRAAPVRILFWLVLWSVTASMRLLVIPAHAAGWRAAEYKADAMAAQAGYGDGLYRALTQLRRTFDGARNGWDASVLATHPPTELRLERLEQRGHSYPLPHDRVQPRPLGSTTPTHDVQHGPDKD